MSLLEGDLAGVFASAFGGFYLDAQLYRLNDFTDDGTGGGSGSGFADPEPVKAQLDATTQAMRAADYYVDTDQRIIVLASGVNPITTDCEIMLGGQRWSIASVTQDPASAYYDLHGRKANSAAEGS